MDLSNINIGNLALDAFLIAVGVVFAKSVEYVSMKLFKKIDDKNDTFLD